MQSIYKGYPEYDVDVDYLRLEIVDARTGSEVTRNGNELEFAVSDSFDDINRENILEEKYYILSELGISNQLKMNERSLLQKVQNTT